MTFQISVHYVRTEAMVSGEAACYSNILVLHSNRISVLQRHVWRQLGYKCVFDRVFNASNSSVYRTLLFTINSEDLQSTATIQFDGM